MEFASNHGSLLRAAKLRDVCTSSKNALPSGHDDRSWQVGGEFICDRMQSFKDRSGKRIHLSIRKGDDRNTIVATFEINDRFVGHLSSMTDLVS
jgi:hypothetical protein